ncbi:WhiB family transcriptional regulator [Streptomyces sp. O3]
MIGAAKSPHDGGGFADRITSALAGVPQLAGARCDGIDPELFFPEHGNQHGAGEARAICAECPVREACLAYAVETGERFGIFGGLSYRQRLPLIRERRAAEETAEPVPVPVVKAPVKRQRALGPVECGTRRGYSRHRRNGERACDACRYANAAADRRLRATGSTREAA